MGKRTGKSKENPSRKLPQKRKGEMDLQEDQVQVRSSVPRGARQKKKKFQKWGTKRRKERRIRREDSQKGRPI